jgi:hypothetical protein
VTRTEFNAEDAEGRQKTQKRQRMFFCVFCLPFASSALNPQNNETLERN